MSSISNLLSDLEEDIIFINDITLEVSSAIKRGKVNLHDVLKLADTIVVLTSNNGVGLYRGPEGSLVNDIASFLEYLKATILANKYSDVAYAFWLDYTDDRARRFGLT